MAEERSRASEAMDRYADGDSAAFAVVYDDLSPRLFRYLRRLLRSETEAGDVLQQVFLQIHAARGRFARGEKVEPWAYAIARRLVIDGVRRAKRGVSVAYDDEQAASDAPDPEQAASDADLAASVTAELASLPADHREAFVLVRVEGLSVAEAAAVLGISEASVKVRAHRGGATVRDRVKGLFGRGGQHG